MTLVLRYISDEISELYKLRRGKLNFLKTGPIDSLLSKKFRLVILAKENFVSSSINIDDLNFTPDADQFLFSEKSIMSSWICACLAALITSSASILSFSIPNKMLFLIVSENRKTS